VEEQRSKTLKVLLTCAVVLIVAAGAYLLLGTPEEKKIHYEKELEVADVNSYDPEDINSFVFGEAATASVLVRKYIEGNKLSNLWVSVEKEKDVNLLVVYNIPTSEEIWKGISRKMPEGAEHPYSPALVKFTKDALKNGACVANITNIQGDIVICVGVDKEAALNAIREYAMNNMKCKGQDDCAVSAIDDALKRDVDTTVILYVGAKGKVLRVFEPKRNSTVVWYEGMLIDKGGI